MSLLMMLAFRNGGRALETKTFTTSQYYTIPAGVTVLRKAKGYGAKGKDGYWRPGEYVTGGGDVHYETIYYRRDGNGTDYISSWGVWSGDVKPEDTYRYEEYTPSESTVYYAGEHYVSYYGMGSHWEADEWVPATTGDSSTGFGKSFNGSYGNTVVPLTEYENVPVTPGQQVYITIATDGSITIEY